MKKVIGGQATIANFSIRIIHKVTNDFKSLGLEGQGGQGGLGGFATVTTVTTVANIAMLWRPLSFFKINKIS